jgi:predicted small secreted protein
MKPIIAMTLIAAAFAVAGCNTLRGAGQDIEKAGQTIEDAAKKK